MKKLILITLMFTGVNFKATAQTSKSDNDSTQIEILQLTTEWNKAIVNRDSLTLSKVLSPEFSLNGTIDRSVWLNNTLNHITTDTLAIVSQLNITIYDQVAKTEGVLYWKAEFDGKPIVNGEFLITDIWTKQSGHWQVMLRMSLPAKVR
jgi:hypothetical protein